MNVTQDNAVYDFIDRTLMGDHRNRTLFDWSPLAIVIIDKQGIFVDANRKLYDWLSYKPEEIIGKNLFEIPFFTPETKEIIIQNFKFRVSGKDIPAYEVEFIHKNGSRRWGEIHGVIFQDTVTHIILDIIMVSDITERKETLEQLKQSEEKYRNLFESATDLIQSIDADGRFVDVNPQWLKTLGYTKEEIKNLTFTDILRKDQIKQCQEIFQRICHGEKAKNVETVFVSKTGKEIVVEGNINGLYKAKKFVATVGIFRDITEKKSPDRS